MNGCLRAVLVSALLSATCASLADPVPQAIKDRYKSLKKVMDRVDFAAFQSFFAPEFVSVNPEGKSSGRKAFLAEVKPLFDGAKRGVTREKLISASKSRGLVHVKFDMHLDLIGQSGTTHVHEVGVDSWKKIGGRWLFVKTVDSVFTVTAAKGS